MKTVPLSFFRQATRFLSKNLVQVVLSFSIVCLAATQAAAQYGGGGGTMGGTTGGTNPGTPVYTPPSGGYSSAKGAAIGAGVAAGAGALILVLHYRGRLTGCVQPSEDGMRIVDEKKNQSYKLVPSGVDLKPGELVELKGHKSKVEAGAQTFEAHKLIKDLGACGGPASASSGNGTTR